MGNQNGSFHHHHARVKEAMRKDDKIEEVFNKFDRNQDGVLDRKEARLFIQDICDIVCETEMHLTANWDNGSQVPQKNVKRKWKYAKDHADDLFLIIDEDETGVLTLEEVTNFLHKTDLKFWMVYFGKIGWYKELLKESPNQRTSLAKMGLEEYL